MDWPVSIRRFTDRQKKLNGLKTLSTLPFEFPGIKTIFGWAIRQIVNGQVLFEYTILSPSGSPNANTYSI